MKKKLVGFLVKIRKKINQLEFENYISQQKKQCETGKGVKLYQNCSIYDGNHNGRKNIKIGDGTHIKGELLTLGHGGEINVGDYSYIGPNTHVWSGIRISIGDRVLIGSDCNIFDNDIHPLDAVLRHRQFLEIVTTGQPEWVGGILKDKEILIKDDAWIGCNVVILKGVTIGEGAVVGAGSVVTHDIPDHAVAHGNPARVYRFTK